MREAFFLSSSKICFEFYSINSISLNIFHMFSCFNYSRWFSVATLFVIYSTTKKCALAQQNHQFQYNVHILQSRTVIDVYKIQAKAFPLNSKLKTRDHKESNVNECCFTVLRSDSQLLIDIELD